MAVYNNRLRLRAGLVGPRHLLATQSFMLLPKQSSELPDGCFGRSMKIWVASTCLGPTACNPALHLYYYKKKIIY